MRVRPKHCRAAGAGGGLPPFPDLGFALLPRCPAPPFLQHSPLDARGFGAGRKLDGPQGTSTLRRAWKRRGWGGSPARRVQGPQRPEGGGGAEPVPGLLRAPCLHPGGEPEPQLRADWLRALVSVATASRLHGNWRPSCAGRRGWGRAPQLGSPTGGERGKPRPRTASAAAPRRTPEPQALLSLP